MCLGISKKFKQNSEHKDTWRGRTEKWYVDAWIVSQKRREVSVRGCLEIIFLQGKSSIMGETEKKSSAS